MSNRLICPKCTKIIEIQDSVISNNQIQCPHCNSILDNPFLVEINKELQPDKPLSETSNNTKNFLIAAFILLIVGYYFYDSNESARKKSPSNYSNPVSTHRDVVSYLKRNAEYDSYSNSITVNCQVGNNSNKLITYMDAKAVFYDKAKNIVGVGFGNLSNIRPRGTKVITIVAFDIEDASTYDIETGNVFYDNQD